MVINSCPVAEQTNLEQGLTPYTDIPCAEESVINDNIDVLRLGYKIMSQNFNPEEFKENGRTTTVMRKRFTTDLVQNFVPSIKFSVVENTTNFFQSWFIDLRDFSFLFGKSFISCKSIISCKSFPTL